MMSLNCFFENKENLVYNEVLLKREDYKEIIGIIRYKLLRDGQIYIDWVEVDSDYHHNGLATKMIEYLLLSEDKSFNNIEWNRRVSKKGIEFIDYLNKNKNQFKIHLESGKLRAKAFILSKNLNL